MSFDFISSVIIYACFKLEDYSFALFFFLFCNKACIHSCVKIIYVRYRLSLLFTFASGFFTVITMFPTDFLPIDGYPEGYTKNTNGRT